VFKDFVLIIITIRPLFNVIFCFSSKNSEFGMKAGGSLPLSIIVKNDFNEL